MQLSKRVLCSFAVLAVVVLVACGGTDVGVSSDEIVIGTWAPLTGPASNLSTIVRAMEAYFAYVNAEGGVNGRKLRLIIKDDGYDPSRTPEVVRELVEEDRIFAILGGNGTANCLAVKDYMAFKAIPWVNPGSGVRVWTTPVIAYVFSTFPTYVTEGRILAKYVVEELEAKKYGLLYQDGSFGREGQEGVRVGLRAAESKEVALEQSYNVGDTDLSDVAQKFKDEEIDLIFVWTISEGAAALVRALDAIEDYSPQIVGTQLLSDPIMFELVGESWEGAILASSVPEPTSDEPGVVRAREIIRKYGQGIEFGTYAMWGLSRAEVLVEGMRRAGPKLTRMQLIASLETIKNWSDNSLGTPISFSRESHQGLNAIHIVKAEGGTLVHLSDWMQP